MGVSKKVDLTCFVLLLTTTAMHDSLELMTERAHGITETNEDDI